MNRRACKTFICIRYSRAKGNFVLVWDIGSLYKYSVFLDSILLPLIAFCFLNSSATQFYPTLCLHIFCYLINTKKLFKTHLKNNTLYTCKQPLMKAYEWSESARNNFGKFIHQFQPETKTLIRKLKRKLIKLYRQNVSLLFNETCLNERLLPNYTHTHTHTHTHIYMCVCIINF